MNERWHIHTGTGYSVRTDSGEIIFEYPNSFQKFDDEKYCRWLDYAQHVCDLHNTSLDKCNGEVRWKLLLGGN